MLEPIFFIPTLPQAAGAWVPGSSTGSGALVGRRNGRELRENVAAADWRLTDEDRVEIDAIFAEEGVPTYADTPQAV